MPLIAAPAEWTGYKPGDIFVVHACITAWDCHDGPFYTFSIKNKSGQGKLKPGNLVIFKDGWENPYYIIR